MSGNPRPLLGACLIWAATAIPSSAQQATTPVVFDRHMTAGAGATVIVGAGDALAEVERAAVPVRLLQERGVTPFGQRGVPASQALLFRSAAGRVARRCEP